MSELYNDLLQAFKEIAEIEKNEDLKAAVEKSEKEASQKEKDIDENIYTGKPDKKKTKKQLDKELPWNVHLGAGNPAKGVSDFNHMNTPTVAADESLSSNNWKNNLLNILKTKFKPIESIPIRSFLLPDGSFIESPLGSYGEKVFNGPHYNIDNWIGNTVFNYLGKHKSSFDEKDKIDFNKKYNVDETIIQNIYDEVEKFDGWNNVGGMDGSKLLEEHLGCIRLNGGVADEMTAVSIPSTKITEIQYDKLTSWLDKYYTDKVEVNVREDYESQIYHLDETIVDDVIKKIKRYYTTGTLVENLTPITKQILLEATRQQLINKSKNADSYARSNQDKGDSAKDENIYIYKSEISTKITGMYKRLNNIYDKFSRYASVETAKTAVNEYNALDKDALQLQRQISSDYTGNMKDLAELRTQIEYMKNYIKKDWPEVKLNEGTWSLPNTKDKAQELVDLLRKDVYKKDVQKLYDLVGDDSLWDDIEARRYNVPVNDLVEKYVGNFIDNYLDDNSKGWTKDSGWKEEWNIDSLKQLAPIVKRFISPKNWNIIFKK